MPAPADIATSEIALPVLLIPSPAADTPVAAIDAVLGPTPTAALIAWRNVPKISSPNPTPGYL